MADPPPAPENKNRTHKDLESSQLKANKPGSKTDTLKLQARKTAEDLPTTKRANSKAVWMWLNFPSSQLLSIHIDRKRLF